jgi:hypothetical protein
MEARGTNPVEGSSIHRSLGRDIKALPIVRASAVPKRAARAMLTIWAKPKISENSMARGAYIHLLIRPLI